MKKGLLVSIVVILMLGVTGCVQPTVPVYNPPVTVIRTLPAVTVTPDITPVVTTTPTQSIVNLPAAGYAKPDKDDQDGIGKTLIQVTLKIASLTKGNLVAIGSIPVWNSSNDDSVYSVTYGIFEKRTDIQPAPDYFSGYVSTYSLVNIAGRTWADIPVVFTVPENTTNLPTVPVYFNIAVHNTNDNGTLQMQGAQRWEISFK